MFHQSPTRPETPRATREQARAQTRPLLLAVLLAGQAAAFQETKVVTIEGNPPTGNEPWEICPGEYAQTAIDTNVDFDTFRMLGEAGDVWRLGLNSPTGLDPNVQIYDPAGNLHDTASCGNGCSITKELLPLTVDGMYTILVFDGNTDEGGPYTISIERMLPSSWIDWLPYNQTQSVVIHYNTDTDRLRFWADAGSTVSLVGNSPTGLDPAVVIYGPQGDVVATGGCGNGCSFNIPLPNLAQTGEYTVCFWDANMDEGGTMQVTLNYIFNPNGTCPDRSSAGRSPAARRSPSAPRSARNQASARARSAARRAGSSAPPSQPAPAAASAAEHAAS